MFRRTFGELRYEVNRLGHSVFNEDWERAVPQVVQSAYDLRSPPSFMSAVENWGIGVVLSRLEWMATNVENRELKNDTEELCRFVGENAKNITLLKMWKCHGQAQPPGTIVVQLKHYVEILEELGVAICLVSDVKALVAGLHREVEHLEYVGAVSKEKTSESLFDKAVIVGAAFFTVLSHAEEYFFAHFRDTSIGGNSVQSLLEFTHGNLDILGLDFTLEFAVSRVTNDPRSMPGFSQSTESLEEMANELRRLSECFQELISDPDLCVMPAVVKLWDSFKKLKDTIAWERPRHRREQLKIDSLLESLQCDDSIGAAVTVCFPSCLEPVCSRGLHRWIACNQHEMVGRGRELFEICEKFEKGAGTVLITGKSGVGKSSLAREAALHLRTAWPIQFSIDLGTQLSKCEGAYELANFFGLFDEQESLLFSWNVWGMVTRFLDDLNRPRLLLVLENYTPNSSAVPDIAGSDKTAIIAVSKDELPGSGTFRLDSDDLVIDLSLLTVAESLEVLQNRSPGISLVTSEEDVLNEATIGFLKNGLKNNPISLDFAGKLLQEGQNKLLQLQARFHEAHNVHISKRGERYLRLVDQEPNTNAVMVLVTAATRIAGDAAQEEYRHLKDLEVERFLFSVAVLAWPSVPTEPIYRLFGQSALTKRGLGYLHKMGFIQLEGGELQCEAIRMHRLVQQAFHAQLKQQRFHNLFELFSDIVRVLTDSGTLTSGWGIPAGWHPENSLFGNQHIGFLSCYEEDDKRVVVPGLGG